MQIDKNFEGGNIVVHEIQDSKVLLSVELRSSPEWFYWAFHVTGCAGKRVHFRFTENEARVGYFGAAVSYDLINWAWGGQPDEDYQGFTYQFGADEDDVFFCHDMRYSTSQFDTLCSELKLEKKVLTLSEKGRPVPYVTMGEGGNVLLLTSRHHCCESTGTYLMEGILRTLSEKPIPEFTVIAIPFVDIDGVVEGDQGKNRAPHDHGRDYPEDYYASVRAIKHLAATKKIVFALDLHSPWHYSGRNDVCHGVYDCENPTTCIRFGQILTQQCKEHPEAFQYDTKNDLLRGVEWNVPSDGQNSSFSYFFMSNPGTEFSMTLETPYYGTPGNRISQPRMIALGRCVAETLREMEKERK